MIDPRQELSDIDRQIAEIDAALAAKSTARQQINPADELSAIDSEIAQIDAQLAARQQQKQELSFMEKAGQVARGIPATYGGMMDIIGAGGQSLAKPVREELFKSLSKISKHPETLKTQEQFEQEIAQQPRFSEALPEMTIDKLYGKSLAPTDQMGKFRQGVGEFLTPLGPVGPAAKLGVSQAAKLAGKHALGATGASAGLNLTPRMSEEGTIPGILEDVAKAAIGAKSASASASLAGKLSSAPIETTQKGLAKAASKFIKPDEELLSKAAKHKIEMPFNVGVKSTPANFVANNYLKSMYASKEYKDSLKKADESLIGAVKRSIDSLGEADVKPSAASSAFSEYLKEEEKVFKKQSDALYDSARKSLSDKDRVVPKNTIKALKSEPMSELLSTLSPSESEKKVIKRVNEIRGKISDESELPKSILERYKNNPKYLETLKKASGKRKDVSVTDLINLRKSLMNTLNYEQDVRGSEAFLSKLVNTLDSDIKSLGNKKFLSEYEAANNFFRDNIGQRFRKSIALSLTRNEAPREAYSLMNSVGNIRTLEKIAGESPKGKELFDSLKKAKVREIISGAVQGDLRSEGSVRGAALARLFQKGENRQELLHKLLGEKEYRNLSEIAEISDEFAKSGRELLNTSGTAHVLSDMNLAKDVSQQVLKTLAYFGGSGAVGYTAAGPIGAGVALGMPYAVSRLVANPKFVNQMRAYAIARKQGKNTYADTIMSRSLVPLTIHEINLTNNKEASRQQGQES